MTGAVETADLQAQLAAAIRELRELGSRLSALEEKATSASAEAPPQLPFLQLHQGLNLGQPSSSFRRSSSVPTALDDGSVGSAAGRLQAANGAAGAANGAGPTDGAGKSAFSSAALFPPASSNGGAATPRAGSTAREAERASSAQLAELEFPMGATRVVMTQLVSLADSHGMNICSGGTVLSWIDICAGLAAKTLARGPVVTASVDAVHFLRPCHVGSVVIIAAMVNRTFTSSMEVGVRVEEECVRTGARHHCCSAYLTFVALSRKTPNGGPSQKKVLPKVVPTSAFYSTIYSQAESRRAARLQARQRLKKDPELAAQEVECRLHPITHREAAPTLPPALQVGEGPGGRKRRVRPSFTSAHMTQMIMPQHANTIGITFGGNVMRWMEQCAFIAASRVGRGCSLLTAGMDSIAFTCPTRVGDTVYIEGQVTAIFRSSVEVMISVWGEQPEVGEMFHCGDAFATIVSVNEAGGPVDVPFELAPQTRAEQLRYQGAMARRHERLLMREQLRRQMRVSLDGTHAYNELEGEEEEPGPGVDAALQL